MQFIDTLLTAPPHRIHYNMVYNGENHLRFIAKGN